MRLRKEIRRKKPLKRTHKRIKARAKFKAHGDHPLKTYHRRFTDYQVMLRAQIARQARLHNRTRAEMAFCELLDGLGILYESEAISQNGDRFVLIDMYVKSAKIAFEIDGSSHDDQKEYDAGRDARLSLATPMSISKKKTTCSARSARLRAPTCNVSRNSPRASTLM